MTVDHVDPPGQPGHSSVRIEIAYGVVAGGERDLGTHLDAWPDEGR